MGTAEVDSMNFVQTIKLCSVFGEEFRVRSFPFGDVEELGTVTADLADNGVPELFAGVALGLLIILESRFLLVSWITKLVDDWVWWDSGRRDGMVGKILGHADKAEPFGEGGKTLVFATFYFSL